MSILVGKLALFALVPVVGAGVVYPMAVQLGGDKKQIVLEKIGDFEQKCWVSVKGGDASDRDSYKKKLLVCSEDGDLSKVEFYFYDTSEGTTSNLPKVVTEVKKESEEFKITLSDQRNVTISTNGSTWNTVFSEGIKKGCKIQKTTDTDDISTDARKLGCGDKYPQPLEKFQIREQK